MRNIRRGRLKRRPPKFRTEKPDYFPLAPQELPQEEDGLFFSFSLGSAAPQALPQAEDGLSFSFSLGSAAPQALPQEDGAFFFVSQLQSFKFARDIYFSPSVRNGLLGFFAAPVFISLTLGIWIFAKLLFC